MQNELVTFATLLAIPSLLVAAKEAPFSSCLRLTMSYRVFSALEYAGEERPYSARRRSAIIPQANILLRIP